MSEIYKLMDRIKYEFKDKDLLIQALTHRSYINENPKDEKLEDNEKLEFLGDSVLNLITTEYIIGNFKRLNEGELSKKKGQLISGAIFSAIAKEIGLGDYLYLSKGENFNGGRNRDSILEDAFEALIGAIFLDSNYYVTKKVALRFLKAKIRNLDKIEAVEDYKTQLQEHIQSIYKTTPVYNLIDSTGPDHDKVFRVNVCINDEVVAEGVAKSIKSAEKKAAKKALIKLGYL